MASAAPARTSSTRPWIVDLYRSALGKKYAMAISGIVWMGYVLAHMIGNLKIYTGAEHLDEYAEFLRTGLLVPIVPETITLWIMRIVLIVALAIHIHAAYALTVMNRKARPERYQSTRDYVAADFAARTMRWTGVIVFLFILFHLADLTWGFANPEFVRGEVFDNVVASFQRPEVSGFYVLANIALGFHLYHGAWSLFQSLGANNPRFNHWRRYFATAFMLIVVLGNISFPVAVLTGIVG